MPDKTKSVRKSEDLLLKYESARGSWAREAQESEDFALGAQWTPAQIRELKKRKQSPVVVNVIYPVVEQATAILTTNKPRFSSTGREDSDVKTGKVFSEIMSYIWDSSDGNSELKRAVYDAYTKGLGYMFAYIDPNADFGKGDIIIKSLDPFDVYVDPHSKDRYFKDAASIIIVQPLTFEEAGRMYPDMDFSQAEVSPLDRHPGIQRQSAAIDASQVQVDNNIHQIGELIDRYSKEKVLFAHVYDPNTDLELILNATQYKEWMATPAVVETMEGQEPTIFTRKEHVEDKIKQFEETGGMYFFVQDPQSGQPVMQPGEITPEGIPGSQVVMEIITMEALVKAGIIAVSEVWQDRIYRCLSFGGIQIFEDYMGDLSEYPIVPIMYRYNRTPYPISDVTMVKCLQELVNKTRSLILSHAANTANIKIILPRGSQDRAAFDKEWGKAGTAVLEADMELGVPIIVQPPALPNELYRNEAESRKDISEILGIYALMQGDASQAPATYKGTVALDEYGQRRLKSKKDDIEGSLNQLAKCIVQMIQMVYTEPRVIRLLKPNNIQESVKLNYPIYDDVTSVIRGRLNDVTTGKYDLIVVSGSMLPSNRWAQLEYYQNLYHEGIIDQVEVLKKTEVADTEGVLERFGYISQLEQQVQQLMDENKKLSGDLQTATRESVSDRKRLEVVKFGADLKTQGTAAMQSQQLFSSRLDDHLALEKKKDELERRSNQQIKRASTSK